MPHAAEDIVNALHNQTLSGVVLAKATNLFQGPVRPRETVPVMPAVFVHLDGGPAPEGYLGKTVAYRRSDVDVYVRGPADKYRETENLARAILGALHNATVAGYVNILSQVSEPEYLGEDDHAHEFRIMFVAEWKG